jgi:DNA-binding FadR family transcriptional regulator
VFTPVRRRSVSDEVFDQLKERIVRGEVLPGAALPPERTLAEMLGVNRGALREALKRLEQARLVSIQHGGTTRVANFMETAGLDLLAEMLFAEGGGLDVGVARSIMEMRSAIAPDIARLAALRGSDEARAAIVEVTDEMEAYAGDTRGLQLLAMQFWATAVAASGNVAYKLAYNTLRRTYEKIFDLLTDVFATEVEDIEAHAAIAHAIRRRDTREAERRTQALIQKGADRIDALLNALSKGVEP